MRDCTTVREREGKIKRGIKETFELVAEEEKIELAPFFLLKLKALKHLRNF
jgi:hypothetical protein